MLAKKSGIIVGISSLADARGIPGNSIYCSSKAAISHVLEAARIELEPHNIKVISVKPGFVKTNLTSNSNAYMPFIMSPDAAAKIIVDKIIRGKERISFPLPLSFLSKLGKIVPDGLYESIIKFWKRNPI